MKCNLLVLDSLPILEQLQLEEALLRADDQNWCLINRGSPPAVVMGISGKAPELLDADRVHLHNLPVIRRFSGGGTVVVDESTLFITLLGNHSALPITPFPEPLLRWTGDLYRPCGIEIQENDYVIGKQKCGGNAQYLRKNRWLHHTSFIWDYCPDRMSCLRMPNRVPDYRQGRSHDEFLTRLCRHFTSPDAFLTAFQEALSESCTVEQVEYDEVLPILERPHRRATRILESY